jgi:hypothetical protein
MRLRGKLFLDFLEERIDIGFSNLGCRRDEFSSWGQIDEQERTGKV